MGDQSKKSEDRPWSGAIGQTTRELPKELKNVLKLKKISNKQAARPITGKVSKILKGKN